MQVETFRLLVARLLQAIGNVATGNVATQWQCCNSVAMLQLGDKTQRQCCNC